MQTENRQPDVPAPLEIGERESQASTDEDAPIGMAVIAAVIITLVIVLLGFPSLRDWLLTLTTEETRAWLLTNKPKLAAWVDWLRIVFEVVLAIFISNQIFNDPLRKWFERSLDKLRNRLSVKIEKSIKGNDARVKIRNALNEVSAFIYLRGDLRQLPSDVKILYRSHRILSDQIRFGIWFLFLRLLFLKVLNAFSGKLHATAAVTAFWGVLLMKVIKLYLDSPILSSMSPH
jgi:hypothetical protein